MKKIFVLLSVALLLVSCSLNNDAVNSKSVNISFDSINSIRLYTSHNGLTYEPDDEWAKLVKTINGMEYTVTTPEQLEELYDNSDQYFSIRLTVDDGLQNIIIFENKAFTYFEKSVTDDLKDAELLVTSSDNVQELFSELSEIDFPEDSLLLKKPVIYVYPETHMEVNIGIKPASILTSSYPKYNNGWTVFADPTGTLTDKDGKKYSYLYWEGQVDFKNEFENGFVISKEDTVAFLEEKLELMGLNFKERNDFITYWLPELENHEYNKIHFPNKEYNEQIKLRITPTPDTVIRVLMIFEGLDEYEEIEPQIIQPAIREGYTVVEWGGVDITDK